MFGAVSALIYVVGTVPGFILFGARPVWFYPGLNYFKQISWWPKVREHRILPGAILGFGVVVYFVGWVLYSFLVFVFASTLRTSIFSLAVIIVLSLVGYSIMKDTEEYQVVHGYVKAKKARLCPIVEFVEK